MYVRQPYGRHVSPHRRRPIATGQRILFTGPDGIGDYKVKRCDFPHSVGVGSKLPEATSELSYLCRAAPGTPTPMPKQCYVGGVGWGVEDFYMLNMRTLNSNMQLKRAEFRQETEDRVTHRYQNPWQPPPHVLDEQPRRARSTLAWTQSQFDGYLHGNSKWAQSHGNRRTPAATPTWIPKNHLAPDQSSHVSEESTSVQDWK
ncbi:uncharacterized protein C4orf45 [Erpetoichthys calabaricus]|uniref:uncharacterized protein C4orf45 n=1 Tax=Erpetoichthys calabaricus TaxID=27687 RepID=UPI00109F010D|nr:uncharacterized protein C4orf45 [Erpetoichthys calabaricus]